MNGYHNVSYSLNISIEFFQDETIKRFNTLFNGEGSKKVFILFQRQFNNDSLGHSVTNSNEQRLFISEGHTDLFEGKFCYFLRTEKKVDSSVANDGSLIFGEMCVNPLKGIEAALSKFITPMLQSWYILVYQLILTSMYK